MSVLRLKKREERRIQTGHGWVFSNEIDTQQTPLKGLKPGSAAVLETANGKFLAHVYVNPHSLISSAMLRERLQQAWELREYLFDKPYYRWVHSEGDLLPGLTIDRYGDVLVVQITTAGMECFRDDIVDALQSS